MKIWQSQKMDEEPNVLVSYVNAALFMNKETVGGKIKLHWNIIKASTGSYKVCMHRYYYNPDYPTCPISCDNLDSIVNSNCKAVISINVTPKTSDNVFLQQWTAT